MNKKATSFLLPIYFIALLGLVGILLVNDTFTIQEDTPRLGEAATNIVQAYADQDAIQHYMQQAAHLSVQEAAKISTQETLLNQTKTLFQAYLREYKPQPIATDIEVSRFANTVEFRTKTNIRLPIEYGRQPAQKSVSGVFSQWPIPLSANNYYVSSVFGKRILTQDEGSTNHPGIDIPAAIGTPVLAVDDAQVTLVSETGKYLFIQTQSGWTCGYYHVQPTLQQQDVVLASEQVALITQDKNYSPHLDIRCYNPERVSDQQYAIDLFGAQHVASSFEQPADTTYVAVANADTLSTQPYIDPYCLFSPNIREGIYEYYVDNPSVLQTVSGLQGDLRSESQIQEKLDQTCNQYVQYGILSQQNIEVTDSFIQGLIDEIIRVEGDECVLEPSGEYSKFGVTESAYASYYDRQASQEVICSINKNQAQEIYENDYFYSPGFDELPLPLVAVVVDSGINQGPDTAKDFLSEVLVERGFLQEATRDSTELAQASQSALIAGVSVDEEFTQKRIQAYRQLAQSPRYSPYEQGWVTRSQNVLEFARNNEFASAFELRGLGSHQFSVRVESEISQEAITSMNSRRQVQQQVSACTYTNTSCIQEQLPQEFAVCTDYSQQLLDIASECSNQLDNGCSCFIALPSQEEVVFTPTSTQYRGETLFTNWAGLEEESERPAYAFADDDIWNNLSIIKETIPTQELYIHRQIRGEETLVIFSAQAQTPLCEQTITQRYCAQEESLVVSHTIQ